MKITRLRTVVVDLPIEPPILSAIFAIHSTSCILCFLETDQGLVGEGLVHAINGLRVKVLTKWCAAWSRWFWGSTQRSAAASTRGRGRS